MKTSWGHTQNRPLGPYAVPAWQRNSFGLLRSVLAGAMHMSSWGSNSLALYLLTKEALQCSTKPPSKQMNFQSIRNTKSLEAEKKNLPLKLLKRQCRQETLLPCGGPQFNPRHPMRSPPGVILSKAGWVDLLTPMYRESSWFFSQALQVIQTQD